MTIAVNTDESGFYIPGSEYEDLKGVGIPQPQNGFWKPKWNGEQWVEGVTDTEMALILGQPTTIDEIKKAKQQELIDCAARLQEDLVAGYSNAERNTWDRKIAEATAFLASSNLADAPYLEVEAIALSGATGADAISEATRQLAIIILAKSDELYKASARISGTRARIWNQIEAMTDKGTILAIKVEELFKL